MVPEIFCFVGQLFKNNTMGKMWYIIPKEGTFFVSDSKSSICSWILSLLRSSKHFSPCFCKKTGERSNLAGLLGVWVRAHCRNNGGSQSENGANQFFG